MRRPEEVLIDGSTTLAEILVAHKKWAYNNDIVAVDVQTLSVPKRASIYNADIFSTDLENVFLNYADLLNSKFDYSNLQCASLRYANLQDANLSYANLSCADLTGANLSYANLHGANLRHAKLDGAIFAHATLSDVNLTGAHITETIFSNASIYGAVGIPDFPYACPDTGSFIGWKKASDKIICLEIPEDAKRVSSIGRKCRCNKAKVLSITKIDGSPSSLVQIPSNFDLDFIYKIGETVKVDDFDEDRWRECAPGIHFFINRIDAVNY